MTDQEREDLLIILLQRMTDVVETGQDVDLHDAVQLASAVLEQAGAKGIVIAHTDDHRAVEYYGGIDYIEAGGMLDAYKTYNDLKLCAVFTAEDSIEKIEEEEEVKRLSADAFQKIAQAQNQALKLGGRVMRNPLDVLRERRESDE